MSKTKAPSSKRKVVKKTRVNREKAKHTKNRQKLNEDYNTRWGVKKKDDDNLDKRFAEFMRSIR